MAACGSCVAFAGLVEVAKQRGPLPCEPVDNLGDRVFGGVAGRECEDGETGLDDPCRTVDHFGRGVRLGVDTAGFLEFQRRLIGDRHRGAAAEHVKRLVAIERDGEIAPVAADGGGKDAREIVERCDQRRILLPMCDEAEAGDDGADKALGGGDALLLAGGEIDGEIGGGGERRGRGVGQGKAQRPVATCANSAIATMSGLLPDCEMAIAAQ